MTTKSNYQSNHQSHRHPPRVAGRLPPHDLDAEAAVLSAVFLDASGEALDEARSIISPASYYSDANGQIFGAQLALADEGKPTDIVTVASWLRERERLAEVGGASYLAQLADATPAVAHVGAHAEIVATKARMRAIIAEAQRVAAEGYGDVGDALDWCERAGQRLDAAGGIEDALPAGMCMPEALRVLFEGWKDPEKEVSLTTGLPDLDRMIGGLRPGHLITIGALSGVGKSAMASGIADHVVTKERVLGLPAGAAIFTVEMGVTEYAERLLSARSRINSARLLPQNRGAMTREQWGRITEAATELHCPHLYLDNRPGMTPSYIRGVCRKLARQWTKAGHPLRLIVVDYAQIIRPDVDTAGRGKNREQEVASIGRAMKELAMELGVTVLLLAQLNLNSLHDGNRRPRPSDLRESAALEQDSNAVILIHRPKYLARMEAYRNGEDVAAADELEEVDLIVGKVRGGGTQGTVRVMMRTTCGRFESAARGDGP